MFIRFVIPLAAQLLITVANDVPKFDVTPSCRAAAQANAAQERLQTCLQSEQRARDELVQKWSQYPASDRSLCAQTAAAGGEPTYSELITCLEMTRDVHSQPAQDQGSPPAGGPGMPHRQPTPANIPGSK